MSIEEHVEKAIEELAQTVEVSGPHVTDTHTCYIVRGLSETPEQMENLAWCLLGFVGQLFEADLRIDSVIGVGTQAQKNLMDALKKRLDVDKELTLTQKERKRNPLLQELVAHTLVVVHQRVPKFPEWLGEVRAFRRPHLSPNESGLDLIAASWADDVLFAAIGEVKAYADDPLGGFRDACTKFTQVHHGEYNDEIRGAIKDMDCGFTKQDIANSIWLSTGRFCALVGHDAECPFDEARSSSSGHVRSQPGDRLFFIASPFGSMVEYFDVIAVKLVELAERLGRESDAG